MVLLFLFLKYCLLTNDDNIYAWKRNSVKVARCILIITKLAAGVISGALLYIRDEFEEVNQSSFLQVCNANFITATWYAKFLHLVLLMESAPKSMVDIEFLWKSCLSMRRNWKGIVQKTWSRGSQLGWFCAFHGMLFSWYRRNCVPVAFVVLSERIFLGRWLREVQQGGA